MQFRLSATELTCAVVGAFMAGASAPASVGFAFGLGMVAFVAWRTLRAEAERRRCAAKVRH